MAFYHGVRTSEIPTAVIPPVKADRPAVIIGVAPIHLSKDGVGETNKPVMCYTLADAVSKLGYSADWQKYSLAEAIYTFFNLYAVGPVVFINVLDPAKHKSEVTEEEITLDVKGKETLKELGALPASVVVKHGSLSSTVYELNKDYILSFDDDEKLVVTKVTGGTIDGTSLKESYSKLTPETVSAEDIIGGYEASTGKYKGLELIEQVFPKTRLVPQMLLAPGWSHKPEIAAVMTAKAKAINTVFPCITVVDIPVDDVKTYTSAAEWKNTNNYMAESMVVCWPKLKLSKAVYHMSTQESALMMRTDVKHGDIPYKSPSNESFQADGCTVGALSPEDEVTLALPQANYLNSQGIVTSVNFIGGWKSWGNWTACYHAVTDVKDAFISVKRMFYWERVHLVQTYWQKVDDPTNKRLIQTLVESENINLNGLAAQGVLVGTENRVEFREVDNPVTELLAGSISLHLFMTPCIPAADINYKLEFNVKNLNSLFS